MREDLHSGYAEIVFCIGFLIVYLVDELVHYCFGEAIQHSHGTAVLAVGHTHSDSDVQQSIYHSSVSYGSTIDVAGEPLKKTFVE